MRFERLPYPRQPYEILSPRLIIRHVVESDAEVLRKFITTPNNFPFELESCDKNLTVETIRNWIVEISAFQSISLYNFLVVTLANTGRMIGYGWYDCRNIPRARFGLGASAARSLRTNFGLMLDHKHWRKGLGFEAVCSLVEYAVGHVGCEQFATETVVQNEPWKELVRKLGLAEFTSHGPLRADAKVSGWLCYFDARHWAVAKARMQNAGKWPL